MWRSLILVDFLTNSVKGEVTLCLITTQLDCCCVGLWVADVKFHAVLDLVLDTG